MAQAWALVVGSIVTAAAVLTILAKVPGGRWVFRRAIADPVLRKLDERAVLAVAAQAEMVKTQIRNEMAPFERKIEEINQAVNNVAPGVDPIKTKVADLQTHTQVMDGKLDLLIELVQSGRV